MYKLVQGLLCGWPEAREHAQACDTQTRLNARSTHCGMIVEDFGVLDPQRRVSTQMHRTTCLREAALDGAADGNHVSIPVQLDVVKARGGE